MKTSNKTKKSLQQKKQKIVWETKKDVKTFIYMTKHTIRKDNFHQNYSPKRYEKKDS